jgi:hypothetical protein
MAVLFGALPFMAHRPLAAFTGMMAGVVVALVIGTALALYGLWSKFILGAERSATAKPGYETSKTLIRIGLFWGALVTLIGATLALIVVGVFIAIVGAILLIAGYVGLSLPTAQALRGGEEHAVLSGGGTVHSGGLREPSGPSRLDATTRSTRREHKENTGTNTSSTTIGVNRRQGYRAWWAIGGGEAKKAWKELNLRPR